jgi:ABC-type transport system involved in multi-copper enzyme maturation permease subunit
MGRLLRAEWMKMWGRPGDRYVLAGLIALALVAPIVLTAQALWDPEHHRAARLYLNYPTSLNVGAQFIGLIAVILASFLAASTFGSEYSDGTWKLIVPRLARRGGLIVAKLLMALGTAIAASVLAVAVWMATAALCTVVALKLSAVGPSPEGLAHNATVTLAVSLLRMLFCGAVAALATIAARSSLVGLAVGVVMPAFLDLITYPAVAPFMPNAHLANFRFQLFQAQAHARPLANIYDLHAGAPVSLLVVLAYVGVLMAATACLFDSQEVRT